MFGFAKKSVTIDVPTLTSDQPHSDINRAHRAYVYAKARKMLKLGLMAAGAVAVTNAIRGEIEEGEEPTEEEI
jgi:hypothetical protein